MDDFKLVDCRDLCEQCDHFSHTEDYVAVLTDGDEVFHYTDIKLDYCYTRHYEENCPYQFEFEIVYGMKEEADLSFMFDEDDLFKY